MTDKSKLIGIVAGAITPLIGLWIYIYTQYHSVNPFKMLILLKRIGVISQVWSVCLLLNMVVFYFFLNRENNTAARGVMLSTIVYAILGAVLYFTLGKAEL